VKDKRVLVTGASGFIASHLVRRLVSEGAQVGAMVRYAAAIACPRLADVWHGEKADAELDGDVEAGGIERHCIGEEGERRHHDRHCDQGRRHEIAHRVDAHDAERIDLLVDLHGREPRRERRARAPGHQDAGDERRELAHDGQRDSNHHLRFGAEAPERIDALHREHHADGGRQHGDDRDREDADLHHLPHHFADANGLAQLGAGEHPENGFAREHTPMADHLDGLDRAATERLGRAHDRASRRFKRHWRARPRA